MSRDEAKKLVGGYATGTLTPEERQALFEAALEDQELFDALGREQPLRDLLGDPAAKAQLLAALGDAPATWRERAARWMWGHAVGLAAVACFVAVGGYVAREAIFKHSAAPAATEQAAAEPAPPRRIFVPGSVKKPAASLPKLPAPPVIEQSPEVSLALPPPVVPPPPLAPPVPAAAPVAAIAGGIGGAFGGAGAGNAFAGGGGGRGGGALAGALAGPPGTLTGSIVDSSGAAVPGARIEAKDVTTGALRETVSGPDGSFALRGLAPSTYDLTAHATGFKAYESNNLAVTGGAPLNLGKMHLSLGALTEQIGVTAAATPVQTASSENSKLTDTSQLTGLPLKGRDLVGALATVAPQAPSAAPVGGGKLAPALVALLHGAAPGVAGVTRQLAPAGEVNVRITVTNASEDSLAQLKTAGFTIARRDGNELTGHVAVQELEAVALLPFVVWVAPQ